MMRLATLAALAATAAGHAGLIIPTTRNSIDRLANGFGVAGLNLGTPCTCADKGTGQAQGCEGDGCPPGLGDKCASGTEVNVRAEGGAGQPCLWWSQVRSRHCHLCCCSAASAAWRLPPPFAHHVTISIRYMAAPAASNGRVLTKTTR